MWGALAAGLWSIASSASLASDVVRLGGPLAESAIQGDTNTELVWRRGGYGGYGHGGYGRGYGYGYGRGYGYGGYGRGYGYGGYGRGYGYGGYGRGYGYGGYGRGYGYGGYGYGGYGRGYGYGYGYGRGYGGYGYGGYGYGGYGYGGGYYGIAGDCAPLVTLQSPGVLQAQAPQSRYSEPLMPPADGGNGTYPYNGGPVNPVPLPDNNPVPTNNGPRGIVPLDGKLVSLPSETTGGVSPTSLGAQRYSFVSTTNVAAPIQLNPAPTRIAYPAYGDEPIRPAPRKIAGR